MAKRTGRSFLFQLGDGGGSEVFTTVASVTSKDIDFSNEAIDVTTPDTVDPAGALWADNLPGKKMVAISVDGVFDDADSQDRLQTLVASNNPTSNCKFVAPGHGTYEGNFFLENLQYSAPTEAEGTFSLSLKSNGAVTFTAV